MFRIIKKHARYRARLGRLSTPHGSVTTPVFMPIATKGSVKALSPEELQEVGATIILGNTYHLFLRPGLEVMKKISGLHRFMNWSKPILTDSGGYQVFSLGARKQRKDNKSFARVEADGVHFTSHLDGSHHFLTPTKALDIQLTLGSDIIMVFDECPPYPSTKLYADESRERTADWARKSYSYFHKKMGRKRKRPLLFGIVQGSTFLDIRQKSVVDITAIPFDGYALGGLAVGESPARMRKIVSFTAPLLPENKPRYLMGVGRPEDIIEAVASGIDMFDCVIPTRNARHGQLFTWKKAVRDIFTDKNFYQTVHITNKRFKKDKKPVDARCGCYTCKHFTRGYLNHLFRNGEPLSLRLATIHNLKFYMDLMSHLKKSIKVS